METKRGKKHKFLGMDLEFLPDKNIKILMADHLRDAIETFPEEIKAPSRGLHKTDSLPSTRIHQLSRKRTLSYS